MADHGGESDGTPITADMADHGGATDGTTITADMADYGGATDGTTMTADMADYGGETDGTTITADMADHNAGTGQLLNYLPLFTNSAAIVVRPVGLIGAHRSRPRYRVVVTRVIPAR